MQCRNQPKETLHNIGAGDPQGIRPALSRKRFETKTGNAAHCGTTIKDERHMFIYVLDKDGRPLMPTQHAGKVRRMLRDGRARIAGHAPFTIQLLYETTTHTQPVALGLNPGSKVAGISASTDRQELYHAEVRMRTDIVKLLSDRRETRRTRRSKRPIRYRAPRFDNRRASRKPGWLPPSVLQRVNAHVRLAERVCAFLPVTSITVETAQFDMQKIKNPNIAGTDYQHGEQEGFDNVREYVLWRDGHKCRNCNGKSKDPVLEVHHIETRKTGGDSPGNLVTLCRTCHEDYHKGRIELKLTRTPSLRDAAAVNIYRCRIYDELKARHGDTVHLVYGYTTKSRRIAAGLPKTSETDALCIAGNTGAARCGTLWQLRCLRRHNRKVMKSNLLPGGRWRRNQAPREVFGFRQFDIVEYQSTPAYIHGRRSTGFFVVKDAEGRTVSNSVSHKKLKLISHSSAHLAFQMPGGSRLIPPPAKAGGILKPLS